MKSHSAKSLARKLGIKSGFRIWVSGNPRPYPTYFDVWPDDVYFLDEGNGMVDFIHIFVTTQAELNALLKVAKPRLKKDSMLWISWPKKSSKLVSEIDKFDVMRAGQKIGLVDVKVAAINDDWSGHKFVYRLKDRT